jgi:hypothetical protein
MAKPSAFRDFIAVLRKHWRTDCPFILQPEAGCGSLPKASTFYAGIARPDQMHVYLYFQHSSKSWEVGQFTINVVFSKDEKPPSLSHLCWTFEDCKTLGEGYVRIGRLVGSRDKWWHLKHDKSSVITEAWRPSSYASQDIVLQEAAEDVTRDVLSALRKLGVSEADVGTSESVT